ncbi:MAG TPA: hypothetical protein VNH64_12030 [Parvularculaceae bacterium]|nr:hypothetical protein [Parvularculaceae bacterium]
MKKVTGSGLTQIFAAIALLTVSSCGTIDTAAPAACPIDYAAAKAKEIEDINAGEKILDRVYNGEISEDALSPEDKAAVAREDAILDNHARPVDEIDLKILEATDAILSSPKVWNRHDNRQCGTDDKLFSLFCALHKASIDVTGEYEHRRTALTEVRFAIEDARPGVEYHHRMMDFNNEARTTFQEIKGVIHVAEARVKERLDQQARCTLAIN